MLRCILCALVLVLVCARPVPAQQAPPPVTVVRVVTLGYLDVRAVQGLLGMPVYVQEGRNLQKIPAGPLSGLVPREIDALVGFTASNALLVRATAPTREAAMAAVDQLVALLALLDRPGKRIVVEVMLLETTVDDARALGLDLAAAGAPASVVAGNGTEGNFGVRAVTPQTRAAMTSMIVEQKGRVTSTVKAVVPHDGASRITLSYVYAGLDGLDIRSARLLPDRSIILQMGPVYSVEGLTLVTPVVRARDGETFLLGAIGGPAAVQTAQRNPLPLPGRLTLSTTDIVTLVFVTPTSLPEELTPAFPGFRQLAPLY